MKSFDEESPVFRNCNVCGRELKFRGELAIGMCAICADEEIPIQKEDEEETD